MTTLYFIGTSLAIGLFVYLVIVLFFPERFT